MTIDKAREIAEILDAIDRYEEVSLLLSTEMKDVEPPYTLRIEFKLYHEENALPVSTADFQSSGDCWDARIQQAMIQAGLTQIEIMKQELAANLDAI